MKALAVIGMIIGLLLVITSVVNGITYSDRIVMGEVEYLIGGLLLFFLSASLWSLRSLKDSIDSMKSSFDSFKSNLNTNKIEQNQTGTQPIYAPHYVGIPRKSWETHEEYQERVEKEKAKQNQPYPR